MAMLAEHLSLVEGHCEIVPAHHIGSQLQCDESTVAEIERFKSCLDSFFDRQKKRVLFVESAVHLNKTHSHCVIDAVPVDRDACDEALIHFKHALQTCDEEWSQHKKLLPLTIAKPLAKSIPARFPYVSVERSALDHELSNRETVIGYAHVVENDAAFNRDFGMDVMCGYWELDPMRMKRSDHMRAQRAGGDSLKREERHRVQAEFSSHDWDSFDWTKYQDMI